MITPATGAWIAHGVFVALLLYGTLFREITVKTAVLFAIIWLVALGARPYIPYGIALFVPFVAILDIVLVLLVLKRDIRLT